MKKVKFIGPSKAINVGDYGPHKKDEVKEYPDDVADELVQTARRNLFEFLAPDNNSGGKVKDPADEADGAKGKSRGK